MGKTKVLVSPTNIEFIIPFPSYMSPECNVQLISNDVVIDNIDSFIGKPLLRDGEVVGKIVECNQDDEGIRIKAQLDSKEIYNEIFETTYTEKVAGKWKIAD